MNPVNAMIKYRATKGLELVGEYVDVIAEYDSLAEAAVVIQEPLSVLKNYQKVWDRLNHRCIRSAAASARLSLPVVVELGATASYRLRYHKNRVGLLVELCSLVAGLGVDEAKRLMAKQVSVWLEDQTRHLDVAYMHARVGKDGKRRLTAALGATIAARVDTVLHGLTERIRRNEPELQYDQAYAKALVQKILGTDGDEPVQFGPMFMIATDYRFHSDGTIATTDGALVDINDIVDTELAPTGWAAVTGTSEESPVVPLIGALVKVHNRFASAPQRLAAIMETLVCAWPGCDIPAAKCQIHHIHAHAHGGLTTGVNLAPLCKEHNGKNDDIPQKHVNGRIERDLLTGQPGLRRNPTQPLAFNTEPIAAKTITAYTQR